MKIAALDVAGFGTLLENRWYFGTCSEKRPSAFTRYVDKAQPIGGHGWTAISEKVEMPERRRDARVASLDLEGACAVAEMRAASEDFALTYQA